MDTPEDVRYDLSQFMLVMIITIAQDTHKRCDKYEVDN